MTALTLIMALFCTSLLQRSFDLYRNSAITEQRLQARAAAEGALALLAPHPTSGLPALGLGHCRVDAVPAAEGSPKTLVLPLRVHVLGKNDREAFCTSYAARFERAADSTWRFVALEHAS